MKRALVLNLTIVALVIGALSQTPKSPTGNKNKPEEQAPPPNASITPSSVDFKDQVATKTSKPQTITITNLGGKEFYINSAVIDGDNKEDFSVTKDMCTGATIAVKKSCTIDVAVTPAKPERRIANLVITVNAVDNPQKVGLIVNGINSSAVRPGGR
jgi:hypothetical protein